MDADGTPVTRLLQRAERGDLEASHALVAALYEDLHDLAERAMRREQDALTLQPTALVNEAWLKLFSGRASGTWKDRRHFVNAAAQAMRRVLVDHARARLADKRGGGRRPERLDACVSLLEEAGADLLELEVALEKLAARDAELVRIVELRFFAGLGIAECASALGISPSRVERGWRTARAWLRGQLEWG